MADGVANKEEPCSEIEKLTVDTSDPGKAANVVWAAAVLFAWTSGFNALNDQRKAVGSSMGYTDVDYFAIAEEAHRLATGDKP